MGGNVIIGIKSIAKLAYMMNEDVTPTEKKNETKIFIFYVVLPFYLIILNVFKNKSYNNI